MLYGLADIDLSSPIDWTHPDNAGLALLLFGLPGVSGGTRWPDLTGKTAGATLTNGPTWSGTPYGQSGLALNGTNQYGTVSPAVTVQTKWAVACWANSTLASNGSILDLGAGRVKIHGGKPAYEIQNIQRVLATQSLTANTYYRLGFAKDESAGTLAFYINGRLDSTATSVSSTGTTTLQSLAAFNSAFEFFPGRLAGMAFVNGRTPDAGWFARDYQWSQNPRTDPRLRTLSRRVWLFATTPGGGRTADTALIGSASVAATASVGIASDAVVRGNANTAGSSAVTISADTALYGSATLLFDGGGIVADATGRGSAIVAASASVTVGASAALLGTASNVGSGVALIGATAAVEGNANPAASVAVTISAYTALYGDATVSIQAGAATEVFTYINAGTWAVAPKSATYSIAAKSAAWGVAMPGVPIRNAYLPQDIVINSKFGFSFTLLVDSQMPDPATWSSVRMSVGSRTVDCTIGAPVAVALGWKVPITANFAQADTAGLSAGSTTFQIDFTSPTMEDALVIGTCNIVAPANALP